MSSELEAGSLDESAGTISVPAEAGAEPQKTNSDEPQTFEEMGLRPEVMQALLEMGFLDPMPVQRVAFRKLMAKRDLMVQSRTGSGKTAAFGIPFAQGLIAPEEKLVQALVLAPTRELALQVAMECGKIGQYCDLKVVPIYGGAPMNKQIDMLRAGSQIVAGTPGRVLDHLRRGTLRLDGLKVLVLDEADEMLSMGFLEEITEIIKRCPTERQTILFSATIPDEIERIASRYMREPEKIHLSVDGVAPRDIKHAYYMVSGMGRARDLVRILEVERPESAIIFCNTRDDTTLVAEFLRKSGLDAEAISSDLTQRDRERVMNLSKDKKLKYLVATDIAARGIDITDLSHVINYTFPESAEVYVHRTGRTGRAGKSGVAVSLISPRELGNFYMLKLTYKIKPEERTLPSEAELKSNQEAARVEELRQKVGERTVSDEWKSVARRLWSAEDGEKLVAILIQEKLAAKETAAIPRVETAIPAAPREPIAGTPLPTAAAESAMEGAAPRERAPREERPRERGGERDSRRARGRRGGRGGERERGGRDREARPPERQSGAPSPSREHAREPRPAARPAETIDTSDGREFWEAWVDSKSEPGASAAPPESTAAAAPAPERDRDRDRPSAPPLDPGMVRLYLNLGRRDGVREPEVEAILTERGVAASSVQVRNSHTYLIVAEAEETPVCAALTGIKHGERDLVCERARK